MKSVRLAVVVLALVSISNQNLLGFGEFIAGHNPAAKIYNLVKISDEKYNKALRSMSVVIYSFSAEQYNVIGPCFVWEVRVNLKSADGYENKGCTLDEIAAQRYVVNIIGQNYIKSGSIFFKQSPNVPFDIKDGSRSITFKTGPMYKPRPNEPRYRVPNF